MLDASELLFTDKNGVVRKRKSHCKHGHPFDGTEKWKTNWRGFKCRNCRECDRLRIQKSREDPAFRANETERMRQWRAGNPAEAKAITKRAYQKRDKWIQAFKTKCKFCDESRFYCLDFHHRDSGEKIAAIGQVRHWSQAKLLAEIAKCDVVCANCHRAHHWAENNSKVSEGD